jgi:hypothetical protein
MEYLHTIEVIAAALFLILIIGFPTYFICKLCDTAEKVVKKLDSPKSKSAIKGLAALGGGYWALKKAHAAKTEKERSVYMSLVDGARALACEANAELEGNKSGEFYDDPDWWKKSNGGDQEPPPHPRWN